MLVMFSNQKKIINSSFHPSTYSIPVPVRSSSSRGVPKRKKKKGTLVTFPNHKKIKEISLSTLQLTQFSVPV
jgi:hypothetical protein